MTRLSVLIVSYNVGPLLRRCLTSLSEAAEIVVVDNASTDDSVSMVEAEFPEVTVVALRQNQGFSRAVNTAARVATGDFLLLLNPDTEVPDGVLQQMVSELGRRPNAAALGFRQVDSTGRPQLTIGPVPSFPLELLRMIVQRLIDRGNGRIATIVDRQLSKPRPVPWVSGSSLLVRRGAFEAVGGFDEGFFLYFEDADFCLRLRRHVGPVYYVPSVSILHHRGASAAQDRRRASEAYRASQVRYWRVHRGNLAGRLIEVYQRLRRGLKPPSPDIHAERGLHS